MRVLVHLRVDVRVRVLMHISVSLPFCFFLCLSVRVCVHGICEINM